jgi:hypothetical protein
LPASIEERLNFYENRIRLEEKGINYKIGKESFLNYRLLHSNVKCKMKSGKWEKLIHYTLFYSYLERKQRVRVEYIKDEIGYANRANVIFLTVNKLNKILNKNYKNIKEIYSNPLRIEEELKVRKFVTKTPFNLSPIIILDEFIETTMDIEIDAKIYPDAREILI